jgi:hypothetical protein
MNDFPSGEFNFYNAYHPSDCARIDGSGYLIIGSGDCDIFEYTVYDQLYDVTDSQCVYRDPTVGLDYDLGSCDVHNAYDAWESLTSHTYSEWTTVYDNEYGYCLWENGTGVNYPLFAGGCDGSNDGDRWEAVVISG